MSIVIENLSYVYSPKTPFEHKALDNISLTVEDGDFLGIIGATGSGKSTFIQHLNGLIKLTSGKITVDGIELHNKPDLKKLRAEVGMVFQYPEYQLFDETVEKDVSFGPKNLGLKKDEIAERVKEAVETVGLTKTPRRNRRRYRNAPANSRSGRAYGRARSRRPHRNVRPYREIERNHRKNHNNGVAQYGRNK